MTPIRNFHLNVQRAGAWNSPHAEPQARYWQSWQRQTPLPQSPRFQPGLPLKCHTRTSDNGDSAANSANFQPKMQTELDEFAEIYDRSYIQSLRG